MHIILYVFHLPFEKFHVAEQCPVSNRFTIISIDGFSSLIYLAQGLTFKPAAQPWKPAAQLWKPAAHI